MDAVAAALEIARDHGFVCDEPVVLSDTWHVVVHLRPLPLIARVTSGNAGVDPADVTRELEVASYLGRAGASVVEPTDLLDPGPHQRGGRTVVFWRELKSAGALDAAAAGYRLREIHEALGAYRGTLPIAGRPQDVRAVLAAAPSSDDVELLRTLASRELPAGQALHGDAHLFNCLQTVSGPVWFDLETASRGPREFDLAALMMDERAGEPDPGAKAALAAYGSFDHDLLEHALPIYATWVAASLLAALPRRPAAARALERQMRFLRTYA